MKSKKSIIPILSICLLFILTSSCIDKQVDSPNIILENDIELDYLKHLKGEWIVQGGKEGVFGWEFDDTARGKVILERLKVGTPTEMTTVYNLENGILYANHFCQLQNQPKLSLVPSKNKGELHFLCNGEVGNTKSHNELHMHGVHFQKKDSSLIIWMDMFKNGSIEFETKYELFRINSKKGIELTKLREKDTKYNNAQKKLLNIND